MKWRELNNNAVSPLLATLTYGVRNHISVSAAGAAVDHLPVLALKRDQEICVEAESPWSNAMTAFPCASTPMVLTSRTAVTPSLTAVGSGSHFPDAIV